MKKQKTIAVIPARGGSKRLPGKNLLHLQRIPLLVHSIIYAKRNAAIIERIIVSTDSREIKEIALASGAEVVDRPEHLSTDTATTVSVLKHVLETINEDGENVVLLQPSNPLRPDDLLKEAWREYETGNYDSLVSVSRTHHKLGKIINKRFIPSNYSFGQRSQDLESLYYENGLLYIIKSEVIKREKILSERNFAFIVEHPFAKVDIDVQEDLDYAAFLMKKYE